MKNARSKPVVSVAEPRRIPWGWIGLGIFIAFFVLIEVYSPALNGPFLFDDNYLPFGDPRVETIPFRAWLGVRPLLMVTYWLNYQLSGTENTFSYHIVNIVLHFLNAFVLIALIRKLLQKVVEDSATVWWLSCFAGAVFLLHPAQTEAVAYIASRSDVLSTGFYYLAFAAFLYRKRPEITWLMAATVTVLYGAAVLSKEQAVTLPVLLLLTDYFWTTPFSFTGIKQNWRLYGPLVIAGAGAFVLGLRVLKTANAVGSAIKDFTWYQYFYTQWEVLWNYIRLFVAPVHQNGDYDFRIVRTPLEPLAVVSLFLLIGSLGAAWYYRRRFPLISFGWLTFLLLLTPTSSVLPILDPIVERRLYLPSLGLLLIVVDLLSRARWSRTAMASGMALVLIVLSVLTYQRSAVWGDRFAFWEDVVEKSPHKWRPRFQLASAYYDAHRCPEAVTQFSEAAKIDATDERLFADWGLALDCVGDTNEGLAKLEQAAAIKPSAHIYSLIGSLFGKQGKYPESLQALNTAASYDPKYDLVYAYRGNVYVSQGDNDKALEDYQRALALNPSNVIAQQGLQVVQQRMAQKP